MSNKITIELCTEDRARLDRILGGLEALATQAQFIIEKGFDKPIQTDPNEDIRKALTEAIEKSKPTLEEVAEATKNATEEAEKTTLPITPITEETKPTEARVVTRTELGTKVREMMTKGFKEQTKAIVKEYAPTVLGVPDDKVTECYDRLVALEG